MSAENEVTQAEGVVTTLATPTLGATNIKSLETHVAAFVSLIAGGVAYYAPDHALPSWLIGTVTAALVIGAIVIELAHINLKKYAVKMEAFIRARFNQLHLSPAVTSSAESVARTVGAEVLANAKADEPTPVGTPVAATPPPVSPVSPSAPTLGHVELPVVIERGGYI